MVPLRYIYKRCTFLFVLSLCCGDYRVCVIVVRSVQAAALSPNLCLNLACMHSSWKHLVQSKTYSHRYLSFNVSVKVLKLLPFYQRGPPKCAGWRGGPVYVLLPEKCCGKLYYFSWSLAYLYTLTNNTNTKKAFRSFVNV